MAQDLFYWKGLKKVCLGIYFTENAKIKDCWDLFYWKGQKEVGLRIYFIEIAEIKYG